MGQKVNPHGLRVGVIKDWDSRWFADKKNFGATLVEDYNLRKTLKAQLYNFGIAKLKLSVTAKRLRLAFTVLSRALLSVRAAQRLRSSRLSAKLCLRSQLLSI